MPDEEKPRTQKQTREYFTQPADGVVILKPGVKPDEPVVEETGFEYKPADPEDAI